MEKAIEIKRRAQRCILNGDLDGALSEYEKLVASGDSDPYHSVLLADLLFKKGDHPGAARRYLEAVDGYERSGLVKNAIAVCKKMSRLSLSPASVLLRLAGLHALDGLATESSLYYMQHAELVLRGQDNSTAIDSLHLAFQVCPDNVKALERLAEVQERAASREEAAQTMLEAASQYERLGQLLDARRCQSRADQLEPGISSRPRSSRDRSSSPPSESPPAASSAPAAAAARPGSPPASPIAAPMANAKPAPSGGPAAPSSPPSPARADSYGMRDLGNPAAKDQENSPSRPGLAFDGPTAANAKEEEASGEEDDGGLPEVSRILNEAQALFECGQRDAASNALVRAAQAYDRIGRFENAAAIYRNLSQATEAPLQVMMLWLKNCQRRDDRSEAARVACDLGDRALRDGDNAGAREWFERARAYDQGNELAQRRLARLNQPAEGAAVATVAQPVAPAPEPPAPVVEPQPRPRASGIVEVMVGATSVDLDLGLMISEFQRNLEVQLAADCQGHYDLGMSYREMGLYSEAIHSFELAASDPAFRVRASEMVGRSMLDQGDLDGAVTTFRATLELAELDPRSVPDVRYQLGLALEAAGRVSEALIEFEEIYAQAPSYPQVASKIRALRKALERD